MSQKPSKPSKPSPGTQALRLSILTVAVGLPLYSIAVWMYQVAPIYSGAAPAVVTVLYLPARMLGLVGFVLMFYPKTMGLVALVLLSIAVAVPTTPRVHCWAFSTE